MVQQTRLALPVLLAGVLLAACECGDGGLTGGQPALVMERDLVDFGAVPEGAPRVRRLPVGNGGSVTLQVSAAFEAGSSEDLHLAGAALTVAPGGSGELELRFLPTGAGLDEGVLLLETNDPEARAVRLEVRGGPISPRLLVDPDPASFAPAASGSVERTISLLNDGLARLTVEDVAIDASAGPGFTLRPLGLPAEISPGDGLEVAVLYSRSNAADEGRLTVSSDDPDAPLRDVRLLPDPFHACANGADDDGDGLTDHPDDPGCTDLEDDDETDPPACLDGQQGVCGTDEGQCTTGARSCTDGTWGACRGNLGPVDERCDAVDNDCDGATDEDGVCDPCTPDGVWRLASPARVAYTCCGTMVNVDVTTFTFSSDAGRIQPSPRFPAGLSGAATTCPDGAFDASASISGGCTETYRLAGGFTGADAWEGTLSLTFTGSDCGCFGGTLGNACTTQSFPVTATRAP